MTTFRQFQTREYFFGNAKRTLSPTTILAEFSHLTVYQIRENNALLNSFLPGNDEEDGEKIGGLGSLIYEKITPSNQMLHSVLAVMHAGVNDDQITIRDASVMGFVYVAEVDEKKKRVKLLCPVGGRIDRPLVWGTWPETVGSLLG